MILPAPGRAGLLRDALAEAGRPLDTSAVRADTAYQHDPVAWIVDRLGVPVHTLRWSLCPGYDAHRWDGDRDPLVRVLEALAGGRDVGVESATGTGKTFVGACTLMWFLACWKDAVVVTTAPKEDQLTLHIWKEVGRLWPRFRRAYPAAELSSLRLRMRPGTEERETWAAVGFACGVDAGSETATRAQGFHAEHMLILTEETPGIHRAVMESFENTSTAPHNLRLAFGNPDSQDDTLHRFCQSPGVEAVRISALDHPNVVSGDASIVPGAVASKAIERRRLRYGPDSRLYLSRVRGISPTESAEALIRWAWCQAATARYSDTALLAGLPALGVDVANSLHGDRAAIARGVGAVLSEVRAFACPDASKLGSLVALEMRLSGTEARHVGVDSVGVGASTVNKLKELRQNVGALNGGARAEPDVDREGDRPVLREESFNNLRSQMWWQLRMDLQHGRIGLPEDEELFQDLCSPQWETRGGKVVVESKEQIRKRLGRSPDKGDAAVYWNWVRRRAPLPDPRRAENVDPWSSEALAHEAAKNRRSTTPGMRADRTAVTHSEFGEVF